MFLNILVSKSKAKLIPFVPVIINFFVCLASPVNGEARYSAVVQLCCFVLFIMWITFDKNSNTKSDG